MNIRECKLEDHLRLWEITKTALGYDFSVERMKERLIDILKQPSTKFLLPARMITSLAMYTVTTMTASTMNR